MHHWKLHFPLVELEYTCFILIAPSPFLPFYCHALSFPQCHHFLSVCLYSTQSSEMSPTHPLFPSFVIMVFLSLCIPVPRHPSSCLPSWMALHSFSLNLLLKFKHWSLTSTVWHKIYQLWTWFRSGSHPNILLSPKVENCRTGFRKSWIFTIMVFIKP